MEGLDLNVIRTGLIEFVLVVLSLALHEWAHAFVADALGDDTPRINGRVTLNPLVHIDTIGTIVLPLVSIFFFNGMLLGWGKTVLTNPSNFRHRRLYDVIATLAGPAANFALALAGVLVGVFVVGPHPRSGELLSVLIQLNVALGVFNLLPIPPLDGGYVLRHLVGMSEETFIGIARWSGLVMLLALNLESVRVILARIFVLFYTPFAVLCQWLNPAALPHLFPIF